MDIKGYVVSVIAVSVVGAIVSALAPEGEGGGIVRSVRIACGAVMIAVCIAPMSALLSFLGGLDMGDFEIQNEQKEEYEGIFQESILGVEGENLKDGIKTLLSREFGIDESECRVDVTLSESDGKTAVERIFITLYGSAIWCDTGAIEDYLGEMFSCRIVTAIGDA